MENSNRKVRIDMIVCDAQDGVWPLQRDCLMSLEMAGFKKIPFQKPYISISHNMSRITSLPEGRYESCYGGRVKTLINQI